MNDKYPVIKTVYQFVLAGNWTKDVQINRVKDINDIPRTSTHNATYDYANNTTIIEISVTPTFG